MSLSATDARRLNRRDKAHTFFLLRLSSSLTCKRSQIKTGRVCGTSYYNGEDALSGYMHQAGRDARTPQPEPKLGCIVSVPD